MPKKSTLTDYLAGRGKVKALTRIEAEAFGIPYPLISGWPAKYGTMEITAAMFADLTSRIGTARQSTASKALRGLESVDDSMPARVLPVASHQHVGAAPRPAAAPTAKASLFPGFVLRPARRWRTRKPVS